MSRLDSVEGIREYLADIKGNAFPESQGIIAMHKNTLVQIIDVLLHEIDNPGEAKPTPEGVKRRPLGKRLGTRKEG